MLLHFHAMKKSQIISIAIIIALIVVGIILSVIVRNQGPAEAECDYESEPDKYVGKSSEECSRTQVLCVQGHEYFIDECGCGCAPV